ncbi:MAG: flavodoxin family protein [Clostridiales bacterium]|nr:flavodoxin family protein [Clostridiales bacterium]
MKVLIINGSPHEYGTTRRALDEVAKELNESGIETEIVTVGNKSIVGCRACGGCSKTGKCVTNDCVNEIIEKLINADGLIVGSPVYYSSMNGTLKSLLDRVFFGKSCFANKPAAAIAVARRAGTTSTVDAINKYFTINCMPVVSTQYWNMAFGSNAEQVEQDEEGMQTMRILGKNMAWLLKCIECGKNNGINPPDPENHVKTNFVR